MMLGIPSFCKLSSHPAGRWEARENFKVVFAQPLIIGASVSANWGTASPGRRAALRYTQPKNIRTQAAGGRAGRLTVAQLTKEDFAAASIVIGVDLFFWDSLPGSQQESLRALKKVVAWSAETGVPLVLGDIPELLPGRQTNRLRLNREIHRLCKKTRSCLLWELSKLHQQVLRDGFLLIKGRKYKLVELIPDGLHLSELAGDFLADELESLWLF